MHKMMRLAPLLVMLAGPSMHAESRSSVTPTDAGQWRYMQPTSDPRGVVPHFGAAIPHIVFGGTEWQTTFLFHNPSNFTESFSILFFGDDGEPAKIPILGGMYSGVTWTIPPKGTDKISTDFRADVPDGWAYGLLFPLTGNFTNTYMQTVFKRHIPGTQDSEATVFPECPLHKEQVLIFDQENGYVTGVALANPWLDSMVRADVYDIDGTLLGGWQIPIQANSHKAFALSEMLPVTQNRAGTVVFTTDGLGIVGIGLRFSPDGPFTSFPMITDPSRTTMN